MRKLNTIKMAISIIITFFILNYLWYSMDFFPAFLITLTANFVIQYLFHKLTNRSTSSKKVPKLTRDKERFYLSKGLSNEDITFFRETMMTTRDQIYTLEKMMADSSKLKAIEKRNNTIEISKAMFNDIVKEPERLHEVNQFLYVHLPSLNDLVEKYTAIENHKAKSKATYDILNKSANTIDQLCDQVTKDYLKFKKTDVASLDTSIEILNETIKEDFDDSNKQL
ncbi:MAG TPA: 5-bromo-4-chloroindolyl phosphate hydrolysis family protein [Alloiococcus sp.]|nr:5-bromo-4-chloroindolyl phosphate hydrolysis family protein [Alloiococcus sp.]